MSQELFKSSPGNTERGIGPGQFSVPDITAAEVYSLKCSSPLSWKHDRPKKWNSYSYALCCHVLSSNFGVQWPVGLLLIRPLPLENGLIFSSAKVMDNTFKMERYCYHAVDGTEDDKHKCRMVNVGEKPWNKLALPEKTAPDGIALFSSSLRNKSGRNITHKMLWYHRY